MQYTEKAIIFTGYAASAAACGILQQRKEELCGRYPEFYLKKAEKELAPADIMPDMEVCCGSDGVFGALWRLGERLGCGFCVELSAIPIKQAAIEMCDYADINPYESDSTGCGLTVSQNPGERLEKLRETGINAVIIGYTNGTNARTVKNGEIVRFLTKSKNTEEMQI